MKNVMILVLISVLCSCKTTETDAVDGVNYYFEKPQPLNDSELITIPYKFRGKFISHDSICLNIVDNCIYKSYFLKSKIQKSALDSIKTEIKILNNKIILKDFDKVYDFRILKDSVELSTEIKDTIFFFSKNQTANRFDGQLILNLKDSVFWKVRVISIQKNNLKIKQYSDLSDLKIFDSITKKMSKTIDSTGYLIQASRKEFKTIIRCNKLGYETNYQKI